MLIKFEIKIKLPIIRLGSLFERPEQFYDAAGNNFKAAMKYISEHNLQSQFQKRIDIILHNCESSGWGFPDSMWDIYYEFSKIQDE